MPEENPAGVNWVGCVSTGKVHTGIEAPVGSEIFVTATGTINFGGGFLFWGAPRLGPNGDGNEAPDDYPAPRFNKNSLVCEIGGDKYECGTEHKINPDELSELILYVNDRHFQDNKGEWTVQVVVTAPDDTPPLTPVTETYQAFPVSDRMVETAIEVAQGSTVITEAEGKVDFGCPFGGCVYNADGIPGELGGETFVWSDGSRFSLVFAVGEQWYQGGRHQSQVINEAGKLRVAPNDSKLQLGGNTRGWTVKITVIPPGASDRFDPTKWTRVLRVGEKKVTGLTGTDIFLSEVGVAIKIDAEGTIDVCCAPFEGRFRDPDGESIYAPEDFPAPGLALHSLIVQVGELYYQAGRNAWVVPITRGRVILRVNDATWEDNKGARDTPEGWKVTFTVYAP